MGKLSDYGRHLLDNKLIKAGFVCMDAYKIAYSVVREDSKRFLRVRLTVDPVTNEISIKGRYYNKLLEKEFVIHESGWLFNPLFETNRDERKTILKFISRVKRIFLYPTNETILNNWAVI